MSEVDYKKFIQSTKVNKLIIKQKSIEASNTTQYKKEQFEK